MALWSAALRGHYKPKYYLRDKQTGQIISTHVDEPAGVWNPETVFLYQVEGWERRTEPGDIIAIRPFEEHDKWTETERKEFLIVVLDGFEQEQLAALLEPYYDTGSYLPPEGKDKKLKDAGEYDEIMPSLFFKKRRFHIPLSDLQDMGVDLGRMMDKETRYDPSLPHIPRTKVYDKMGKKYAKDTDKFSILEKKRIGKVNGIHVSERTK